MFSGGFALQDLYRKTRGDGLKISMESACIGSVAGLIVLLIINGFFFEFTPFTLVMAALSALNGMAFTFVSFKALGVINLSLFSLFAMLGGMLLPFFQGIFFFGEGFTVAKAVCLVLVCAALFATVKKGEGSRGAIYYIGVFFFNGMSGVLSKIFTAGEFPKASAAGYSIWISVMTALLSGAVWAFLALRTGNAGAKSEVLHTKKKGFVKAIGIGSAQGAINRVANFLLVIALLHVDNSVQYPMGAGGTMIVSTLLDFFGEKKPGKREIISVSLAFLGMLALFLIPV